MSSYPTTIQGWLQTHGATLADRLAPRLTELQTLNTDMQAWSEGSTEDAHRAWQRLGPYLASIKLANLSEDLVPWGSKYHTDFIETTATAGRKEERDRLMSLEPQIPNVEIFASRHELAVILGAMEEETSAGLITRYDEISRRLTRNSYDNGTFTGDDEDRKCIVDWVTELTQAVADLGEHALGGLGQTDQSEEALAAWMEDGEPLMKKVHTGAVKLRALYYICKAASKRKSGLAASAQSVWESAQRVLESTESFLFRDI